MYAIRSYYELGQALHRLGVRVAMFGVGGAVGPLTDDKVRAYAERAINEEFYLDPDAKVEQLLRDGDQVLIRFLDKAGEQQEIRVDYVLAATGRRANIDKLDIEKTGMELDARGIPVADRFTLQTSQPHIFIAGDASNQLPLLHEAADQGRIAGDNAGRFPDIRAGLRRSPLSVVFSDPQIALVGSTLLV